MSDCCLTPIQQLFSYIIGRTSKWHDEEVRFVLDQHAELDFYSASTLIQQSTARHVAPLGHIILIPNAACLADKQQIPFFLIVFGLIRSGLEHTIYRTRDEHTNHYSTEGICSGLKRLSWLDEPTGTKGKSIIHEFCA